MTPSGTDIGPGMKFWASCSNRLRVAQLGQGNGVVTGNDYTADMLDADILAEQKILDPDRDSWPYALGSPFQEDMDGTRQSTVNLYREWILAGRPAVQ
jgi:hypothetical protein